MYDPRAPKMLRNMLLFCAVLALLGVAVCAAALFRKDWELLTHMAVLFGLLLAVFPVMAAICWITGRFRVAFSTEGIVYLWGNKAYRTIGYAEVKAVTVCGAVDYYYYPVNGEDKKQLAVVSLLKDAHLGTRISPNGTVRFPNYRKEGLLCCAPLHQTDLLTIMNGTSAAVFVTEDMLALYGAELDPVFERFPAPRVMVCCRQEGSRYPVWCTYREYRNR